MYHGLGWRKPKQERRKVTRRTLYGRFKRVAAELQLSDSREIVMGRVFLHDLTPEGVGLFVSEPLTRGQAVTVVIEHPRHLYVKGEVVWCSLWQLNTKVISAEETFRYRIGVKLKFDTQAERDAVESYCTEISEITS